MKRAALIVCAAACGSSPSHLTDAPRSDASVDAVPDAVPASHQVQLVPPTPPDFIAYRNGSDGPWIVPTSTENIYTLIVDADYVVVMVCDNAGSGLAFDVEEFGFTRPVDGPTIQVGCSEPIGASTGSAALTTITGTMKQAGTVQIAGIGVGSAKAPWTYSVTTDAGIHDVLGVDTTNLAVFDQGLTFSGSAAGPTIDTKTGAALASQALSITNLGAGELAVEDDVFANDFNEVSVGSTAKLLSLPLSELNDDDVQQVTVSAVDASGFRDTVVFAFGAVLPPASYPLLPAFTTAGFAGTTASWTQLPSTTFTSLANLVTSPDGTQSQDLTVSQAWLAARQLTSLTFDASAPGFEPAWNVDPTGAEVELEETDDNNLTGYNSIAIAAPSDGPAVARAHSRRAAAPRVHR